MTAESSAIEAATANDPGTRQRAFEFSRLVRAAGYGAVVMAMSAAAATFFVLLGLTPIEPTPDVIFNALVVNGALVAFLIFVVGWELGSLLLARRRGRAGARLHIRVVALFSIVAATPAILVAVVASITLDRGLDNWFSTRMQSVIGTSQSIARAYVDQQAQIMRGDILGLKIDFERARSLLVESPDRFQAFIESSAASRRIPAIFLVDGSGEVITQSRAAAQGGYPPIPPDALADAKKDGGEPILIAPGNTPATANVIGGVVQLSGYNDVFLYVTRKVDPDVVQYIALTEATANDYRMLEASRFAVQFAFGILYLGVSLVVLLSAIWIGLAFANWLVSPIRRLIDAAKEVSRGNLNVAVSAKASEGDLGALSDTFNTMTSQLRGQRAELVLASEQIDSRRRFTEAVLSGVPAGVIGIDSEGRMTIANRTALQLLGATGSEAIGKPVKDALPQLGPIVAAVLRENRAEYRAQVVISRAGRERTINVRLTTESEGARGHGYVITLDDITDLVTAQRNTAWADVARRIAHEIKNPLTPIQLSAERLRRKFGRVIEEDREIFDQCTDTIVRQVGDIGRMVDEFSAFARMPKPTIELRSLSESIREAVFLLEVGHPDIAFEIDLPKEPLIGRFDARLIAQALTNIVKNATEAVAAVGNRQDPGKVKIVGRVEGDTIVVDVIDNGVGLPQEDRRRLLEPYMTTREKGTGLGLAIVTKIIEDHGGRIDLLDAPEPHSRGRGALVRITLPRAEKSENEDAELTAGGRPQASAAN
jgi:two-component system nitrogen regulation sensor histidine kinase NtrY